MRDLVRKLGQRFLAGFHGHEASSEIRSLIRDFGIGHVILFARNVDSPAQVARLCGELQELNRRVDSDIPLLIAVDQEGGRVARLREPWTVWPPLRALGRIGDERLAQEMGAALAAELGACGIRWNMSPRCNWSATRAGDSRLKTNRLSFSRPAIRGSTLRYETAPSRTEGFTTP